MIFLCPLLRSYVSTGILDQQNKGGPYTYFAADNTAIDEMRADTNLGAKIYDDVERRTYVINLCNNTIKFLFIHSK